jgi:hypothetical protein
LGGSAVVDSSGVSSWLDTRRRGGGEDPWLCDPGFHRVCFRRKSYQVRRPYLTVPIQSISCRQPLVGPRLGPVPGNQSRPAPSYDAASKH